MSVSGFKILEQGVCQGGAGRNYEELGVLLREAVGGSVAIWNNALGVVIL